MSILSAISFGGSLLVAPLLMSILCIIFLASIGKSFGVRRFYIKLLLKIFEYGRQNIENVKRDLNKTDLTPEDDVNNSQQHQQLNNSSTSNSSSNSNNCKNSNNTSSTTNQTKKLPNGNGFLPNGEISNCHSNGGNTVITRDALILVPDCEGGDNHSNNQDCCNNHNGDVNSDENSESAENFEFNLANCLDYIKTGVEAIIEDDVTSRFEAEELKNWNLLTRTNRYYEFISWRLTVIWVCGFFVRYIVLMPIRVFICFIGVVYMVGAFGLVGLLPSHRLKRLLNELVYKIGFRIMTRSISGTINIYNKEFRPKSGGFCVANHTTPLDIAILSTDCLFSLVMWLTFCTALVGCMAEGPTKRWMVQKISLQCFGFLSNALSAVITYHDIQNRPNGAGICVANHTSPIDVLVLMCDYCYSLIGQSHGGFLGVLQRALARASPHIWFERAESKDRLAVAQRLRSHVSDPNNPPILIFPEGTCINNTSVMQFKKGSFEVGGVIYPVAIKYDPRFGDPFWNSSKYSMMQYLFLMMTSWAIVCDVWYLPPMYCRDGESAIAFANRVKSVIAKQGGLIDLVWDGNLKRSKPKNEWKEKQQEEFTKRLKGG